MTPGQRSSFRGWHFFPVPPRRNELFSRPAVLLAFCLAACQLACAQLPGGAAAAPTPATPPHQDPYNRVSPESAVLSFLEAYRAKNYVAATRYLDLGKLTPEERRKQGPQLAQELGQALDNDPQFDVAALSPNPEGDLKDSKDPNRDRVVTMHVGGKAVDLEVERTELRS